MRITGQFLVRKLGEMDVDAFVPYPLPPVDPPLDMNAKRRELLSRAEHALARLDVAGEMVPSLDWFIYAFVRKEAVLSSQIEGTQATLVDLLEYEAETGDRKPLEDVREVCNYLDALKYARNQLRSTRRTPRLSMQLLHETHQRLMRGVRGADKEPGEVRRAQNWIGRARPSSAVFVPPPPELVQSLLAQLEEHLHSRDDLPWLVRIGLAHVQFETIHPYLDGNGRMGRLLITLLLEHWKLLRAPLLYLSLFFKQHRPDYYRLLGEVRYHGDWEAWTDYFLEGVATIADEGVENARDIFGLLNTDRDRVLSAPNASVMAIRLLERLPMHPVVTIPGIVKLLETTKPTAGKAVQVLQDIGILVETSGKQRDRTFAYKSYLERLRTGTELDD